jgi:hypothetical protein
MIINPDYDLTKPIQSAIRSKAPYVGVPMPGHAPLIFKRSQLAGALKGVKVVHMEVEAYPSGVRVLSVEGTAGPRVRTRCRLVSVPRHAFWSRNTEPYQAMAKWKPTMAPARVKAPKQTKYDKALIVLQKRLVKLGDRPHLRNPATAAGHPASDRESCLKWYQQKSLRGQVGALGNATRHGKLTSREFYDAMDALPGIGKVTRYSELDTRQKESVQGGKNNVAYRLGRNGFFDYADPSRLWHFMPTLKTWCDSKPYGLRPLEDDKDEKRWGVERYYPVLEWLRQREEILSAIASIREMQQSNVIPMPPQDSQAPTFEEFIRQMAA